MTAVASIQGFTAALDTLPYVPVIRTGDAGQARELALAAYAAGLRVLEITLTVPGAAALISELGSTCPDALVGAGTVLTQADAEAVLAAGARFVVSPAIRPQVVRACNEAGVPAIPGVATATELFNAVDLGCGLVKLFPAAALGVRTLKAFRDVAPGTAMMPTGGVGTADAAGWLAAGAAAIGIGSELGHAWTTGGTAGVERFVQSLPEKP